jgi:glycosyltransferase involved in cell wall biosynthesis
MINQNSNKKIKVLLEMRPAFEGFAGIPQEVRLLFRGLRKLECIEIEGLLQLSSRKLMNGTSESSIFTKKLTESKKINKYSRVVVSAAEKPYKNIFERTIDYLDMRFISSRLAVGQSLKFIKIKITDFEAKNFKDYIWRTLFSKTLPASDFELVTSGNFKICAIPWNAMHKAGLYILNFKNTASYPKLETDGFDIFIGQTPYPAQFNKKTKLVIRYHDAIPIFMPHTISDKSVHQATHFNALRDNLKSGAWFSCVSEATRQDLIKIFPEAAARSITIHNMVSDHYFVESSSYDRVPQIIRSRIYEGDKDKGVTLEPAFFSLREKENFYKKHLSESFGYLLIVSTIEPRKNHARLLAAWEFIKSECDPNLKLVVVGTLGWDYLQITRAFKPWIDRGDIFMLSAVPAPDLRVLYRHAAATVCPSLGEGFDFSGVESMRSGGVTVASDIPVHREVYGNAAEYFDPYSTMSTVRALKKVLYSSESPNLQAALRLNGSEVSSRYLPEKILPQWEAFLSKITRH